MLQSKLERYFTKWILISFVLLSVVDLVFLKERWLVLIGFLIGTVFSILRLSSLATTLGGLMNETGRTVTVKHSMLKYIMSQIVIVILLVASITYDLWLFLGLVVGLLLLYFVIFIISIAKGLGFTKNNFE